jgi:hypothetical protein
MTDKVVVQNCGPIEGVFSIDLSHGPGAYEFRGARGTGKTTLISSLDWLTGHKVDVTLHDAAPSGKVEGFGVVAPVGGRKRRKGKFELDAIDAEKFSLTDLIDPPGKTAEVRDAHAIKALAVLSDADADPTLYYELVGGQQAFDGMGIAETTDPVLLATRIKQAFDAAARRHENTAEAEAKHAAPLEYVPDDVDLSQSSDLDALGAERDKARDTLQRLKAERQDGQDAEQRAERAKTRLQEIRDAYAGLTVKDAEAASYAADQQCVKAHAVVEDLQQQLALAKETEAKAEQAATQAHSRLETATQHATTVQVLEETASQTRAYPSEQDIETAQARVQEASHAYDQGLRIRDVQQNQAKARRHRESAKHATEAAEQARNTAAQVFDVLAQSLRTTHLRIESLDTAPRLFVDHPTRGKTLFDRVNGLSDGERVDYTLRELLPHLESPGLLPIPQRVWQDLQPADRKHLHALAVEKGLYIFGAQVDDNDLRVVWLGDEL